MNLIIETPRLLLREMRQEDAEALFELDNNPKVHKYLGNHPVNSIDAIHKYIDAIQNQYRTNGIGRFVVVLKETNEVIGWAGIKFITEPENNHVNFYDLGYRLQEKHWRKGYALEAAKAWLKYGFDEMKLPFIYASAHIENLGSNTILQKIGMIQNGQFYYEDLFCNWYELENPNIKKMKFNELVNTVKHIPYGRNSNRYDFSLVLSENRGTCSSKHAFLKDFADKNGIPNVKLMVGIYKMNESNTNIGTILSDNNIDYIPEAHCYLKIDNQAIDVTVSEPFYDKIKEVILDEIEIEPNQVIDFKIKYHQEFLKKWKNDNNKSFEELWNIREKCIEQLSM